MSTQTKARKRDVPNDIGGFPRSNPNTVGLTVEECLGQAIALLQADLDALPLGNPPGHWITQIKGGGWVERWIGPRGRTKERVIKGDRLRDWHRGEAVEPARERIQARMNLISHGGGKSC